MKDKFLNDILIKFNRSNINFESNYAKNLNFHWNLTFSNNLHIFEVESQN